MRNRLAACSLSSGSRSGETSVGRLLVRMLRSCGTGMAIASIRTCLQSAPQTSWLPNLLGFIPSRWDALCTAHLNQSTTHVQCQPFALRMRLQWSHLMLRHGLRSSLSHRRVCLPAVSVHSPHAGHRSYRKMLVYISTWSACGSLPITVSLMSNFCACLRLHLGTPLRFRGPISISS